MYPPASGSSSSSVPAAQKAAFKGKQEKYKTMTKNEQECTILKIRWCLFLLNPADSNQARLDKSAHNLQAISSLNQSTCHPMNHTFRRGGWKGRASRSDDAIAYGLVQGLQWECGLLLHLNKASGTGITSFNGLLWGARPSFHYYFCWEECLEVT